MLNFIVMFQAKFTLLQLVVTARADIIVLVLDSQHFSKLRNALCSKIP